MKRWAVAVFLTATFPAALLAQSASGPPVLSDEVIAALQLNERFSTLLSQGRYLDAFELVETADPAEVSQSLKSRYEQRRPALDGFHYVDPTAPPPPPPDPELLAAYEGAVAKNAVEAIIERARDRRIVIVNEAHDSPRDRAFILKLAEALQPLGFTHYAAETFVSHPPGSAAAEMDRLSGEGYPVRSTGAYTDEPMFGYLVRRAIELGYQPVPYEWAPSPEFASKSRRESIVERDQAQADNLARALTAAGPDARFLIHVGYAHATEGLLPPDDVEWMAARLTRLTGIDPLTIDQTEVSENAHEPWGRALHGALSPRVEAGPVVFMKNGAPLATGRLGRATDLQVVHPSVASVDGRPDWLRDTGRRAVPVPTELLPAEGRRLVQAFVIGEADDAVPLDQALVFGGQEPPVLYVPDGVAIRWAVQD